jgi:hypothetical protein
MLNSIIKDIEKLYRAVKGFPDLWIEGLNRPSTAFFKDKRGLSVDRDGGRKEEDVILHLEKNIRSRSIPRLKAIVYINAGDCRRAGAYPIAKPSRDNIYHAEIHDSKDEIYISQKKCFLLSEKTITVKKYY